MYQTRGTIKMKTRIIPYTDKFPFMYQVILPGYIIQTTKKESFGKLVEYLNGINPTFYNDIPAAKRIQIECAFSVRMV
jgi:hypothetical protein